MPAASFDIAAIIGGDPSSAVKRGELVGRGVGGRDIPAGELNLDAGGEQPRPLGREVRLGECPLDRRRRRRDATLAQAQQGETGLGAVPGVAGPAVRLAGSVVVAAQPVQLGLLVEGGTEGRMERLAEALRRLLGLGEGIAHAPWRRISWARWTRHCPRYGTRSGCASHQSPSAAVHSWARRRSNSSWQVSMTAQ